jgi:hypothetical protein
LSSAVSSSAGVSTEQEEAIDDSLTRRAQLVQSIQDTEVYLDEFDTEISRLEIELEPLNIEMKQHEE